MPKQCGHCNATMPDEAKFCFTCGQPIPEPEVKRCANCGSVMPDEAKFCFACGQAIPEPAAQPQPQPEPPADAPPAAADLTDEEIRARDRLFLRDIFIFLGAFVVLVAGAAFLSKDDAANRKAERDAKIEFQVANIKEEAAKAKQEESRKAAEAEIAKQAPKNAAETQKRLLELRKDYANRLQRVLWDRGLDYDVTASGPNGDVLRFKWVLAGRNDLWQLVTGNEYFLQAKGIGYKKVVLTNGEESWTYGPL